MNTSRGITAVEKPAGRGRWYAGLVFLIVLTEQTGLGFLLVSPALPQFAVKYETTQIGWSLTIFSLVGAIATPIVGKLGDRFGKKRVLLITAAIALVGAVVSAIAPTWTILLIGRALSAVSIAFLPISIALIRDVFPNHMRSIGIALTSNGIGAVAVIGPFIAGLLIDNFGVSSVFWFLAAIGVVGSVGVIALIPETSVRNPARIDLLGAVWLAAGLLLLMLGVTEVQGWGWTDIRSIGTIGGGLALLIAWSFYEGRVREPFINTKLLATRPLLTVILVYSFSQASGTVTASYLPTFLQTSRELTGGSYGFGIDVTTLAFYMAPYAILIVAVGFAVGFAMKRTGPWIFLTVGPLFSLAGALVLAFGRSEAWMSMLGYGLFGIQAMAWGAAGYQLMASSPMKVRAATAGMMGAISGVVVALSTQIAGAAMNSFGVEIIEGVPVYTTAGVVSVFLISATLSLAAFVCALFAPRRLPVDEVEADELALVDAPVDALEAELERS
ncbi:MFS transporter [Microbacterium sp. A196]|uniref:MFS transporter n=1 Tax=unclassified Microbacterium TaxID=2609290 RepID=UPI003FCF36BD